MKNYSTDFSFAWEHVALLIVLSILVLFAAPIVYALLIGIALIIYLLEGMKLKLWAGFDEHSAASKYSVQPMISVHLAICNEPPAMVIATIKSILEQDYPHFELIVIDNNTKDEAIWTPVYEFCDALPQVRFFHLKNWPFFKSGALNFARKMTHDDAKFIFVVDADYRLDNKALKLAAENIEGPSIALVQFPQAYDLEDKRHLPIMKEFDHFFDYYCRKADTCLGALATGTLSLIRISALDTVGGWPTNSITEDAELGARLQTSQFDIKYVHEVIGKGIAPIHQNDFIKQRKRWIFGNAQTLFNYPMRPWHNFEKWISGVSQLTAWGNLLGLPILILMACLLTKPWLNDNTFNALVTLSYLSIWAATLSKFLQLSLVQDKEGAGVFRTFLIHFASIDIGAFHWWPVLFGKRRPFVRTDKFGAQKGYQVNILYPFLHLSLFFCAFKTGSIPIALSALAFTFLHTMAIRIDYLCRAGADSNIALNLKLHS